MDLLDDVFKQAGLRSRVLAHRSFHREISLQFPCSKSIGFHVVTQGTAFLHLKGKKDPIILQKGDLALMARGQDHIVSTAEKLSSRVVGLSDFKSIEGLTSSKSKLTLVSGAYQLWNSPVHPFFDEIPDWYVVKADDIESFDKLQMMIGLLAQELAAPDLGSERMMQSLLDIMFSLILRKLVEKNGARANTWSRATQDKHIKLALEILHMDYAQSWTLDDLASEVGLSRAGFALKFKKTLGDTPLHYLTTIRIQRAMELLSSTNKNIEAVAVEVGYQDPFVFSKAFKRLVGISPRDFRHHDQQEKKVAWRF